MTEVISKRVRRPVPVRTILLSWGLAVIVLSGLFAAWNWRDNEEQDRNMCRMTGILVEGPEPKVQSEAADRSRRNRAAIRDYRRDLRCSRFD